MVDGREFHKKEEQKRKEETNKQGRIGFSFFICHMMILVIFVYPLFVHSKNEITRKSFIKKMKRIVYCDPYVHYQKPYRY